MIRYLAIGAVALAAMLAWAALVFIGASEGWGRKPITSSASPEAFMVEAQQIVETRSIGNLALILIEGGRVFDSLYASSGAAVGPDTRFQVASLSKWISAWGVMTLVEDGAIDLDAPVSRYLTRWQLPPSQHGNDGVTVRRLLSHTAGLGDGLGYSGFDAVEQVQSLEESLTQALDASPGAMGAVRVTSEPGKSWNYSGGGYTLLQLLIEEASGLPFEDFMQTRVLVPLGMHSSTFDFDQAQAGDLAANYRPDGQTEPLKRYTSLAATSLFTTPQDLARFVEAQVPGLAAPRGGVLQPETLELMRTPHASELGADIWGLGVMLYAPHNQGDFIIGHDGSNEPAINTAVRVDPTTGDGIIVIETGSPLLATSLAGEWTFWKTGNVDSLAFAMALDRTLRTAGSGVLVIGLLALLAGGHHYRRRRFDRPVR
ncbi:MAG: serine hydrolase domain-containing protein [Pseudomonadales bacterium]